jgi:hypothetical protein
MSTASNSAEYRVGRSPEAYDQLPASAKSLSVPLCKEQYSSAVVRLMVIKICVDLDHAVEMHWCTPSSPHCSTLPGGSGERQISTTMLNGFVAIEEALPGEIPGEKVTRWM